MIAFGLLTNIHPFNALGWVMVALSLGLSIGAISTYWDFLFNDNDNFYMHGLMLGLASLPLLVTIHWWGILARCLVMTVGMGLWSKKIDNDIMEEFGRGFLITATIPLLLI